MPMYAAGGEMDKLNPPKQPRQPSSKPPKKDKKKRFKTIIKEHDKQTIIRRNIEFIVLILALILSAYTYIALR